MKTYTTFLGAVADTVLSIHSGGSTPFDMSNGFVINEIDGKYAYKVEGEAWGFYVFLMEDESGEWHVADSLPSAGVRE